MQKGVFPFANPSSLHGPGREAKKWIRQTSDYLFELFGLKKSHDLIFHSGATEGINWVLKGLAGHAQAQNQPLNLVYSPSDHKAVVEVVHSLLTQGHTSHEIALDRQGEFSLEAILPLLKATPSLLNYTWVHNETGVTWPLKWAQELKSQSGCFLHVDAVQAPGKIENYFPLPEEIDAYTFSGHKFGAMKGGRIGKWKNALLQQTG